ncbi:DegV family protein [Crassaminicella profunda]|uniref:DegV family protein n=1 Tax=Crassaminicella profunda TaxID=1286698 RepID=UPI001CA6E38C|nr:DegV family protein [Crassaminicella profunda]QZY57340.1 DegV family protein [Crassaminicella profunda]
MKPIKIMTTSLSDIPKELIEEYDITVLPLTIRFGDEEFKDREDLSAEEFFSKLRESDELPSTSQITPGIFMSEIKNVLENGYQVMIINGSSGVSGTHQSALMAKKELESEDITVIDTLALSYTCGMIVVEAAKMAKEGKSKEEIIDRIEEMKGKADHIFSVQTLDYLKKGGRLSATKATIGKILNVKPILIIKNGKVELFDKVRGNKKIIPKMIQIAKERGLKHGTEYVCIAHGGNIEGLEKLKEEMMNVFEPKKIVITEIGCTIGTYTGPGLLAILYMRDV